MFRIFVWFSTCLRARQRRYDLDILWPICKEYAFDLDQAKAAFAVHAFHDIAWIVLGEAEIIRQITNLR